MAAVLLSLAECFLSRGGAVPGHPGNGQGRQIASKHEVYGPKAGHFRFVGGRQPTMNCARG